MTTREYKLTGRRKSFNSWAKHLRPYAKRKAHKAARAAAKKIPE